MGQAISTSELLDWLSDINYDWGCGDLHCHTTQSSGKRVAKAKMGVQNQMYYDEAVRAPWWDLGINITQALQRTSKAKISLQCS